MTVYAKNHQSLHKIYKFGSVSKLLAMTVDSQLGNDTQIHVTHVQCWFVVTHNNYVAYCLVAVTVQ